MEKNQTASFLNLDHPGYLGNMKVVDALVRQFVHDVLDAGNAEDAMFQSMQMGSIFAGMKPEFVPIDGRNARHTLGVDMRDYLLVDDMQPLIDIIRTGFMMLSNDILDAIADAGNAEDAKPRVDWLIGRMVAVLLGAGGMYPEWDPGNN